MVKEEVMMLALEEGGTAQERIVKNIDTKINLNDSFSDVHT